VFIFLSSDLVALINLSIFCDNIFGMSFWT
jgi:hypothetical protein